MSDSTPAPTSGGAEHRRVPRIDLHLDMHWKTDTSGIENGTMSDISRTGCFVLTGNKPPSKEIVSLIIPLAEGAVVTVRGEVLYVAEEIGFAVQFVEREQDT